MVNWLQHRRDTKRSISPQTLFRACAVLALPGALALAPTRGAAQVPQRPVVPAPGQPSVDPGSPRAQTPTAPVSSAPGATASPPLVPPPGLSDLPPTAPAPTISGINTGQSAVSAANTAPVLPGKVARISIRGNSAISTEAIRAYISQKIGSPYNPTLADRDRDQVKGMGYFNGEIGLSAIPNGVGGVDEVYTVAENPVIKRIVFTANTASGQPSVPSDKLKTLIDTHEGQVLNTNTLVRDIDKLFNHNSGYMRQQGYIADVSADINIDPNTGTLTIPLVEAYIQEIRVTGNKQTKVVVVTRELRSKPGDVLNEQRLQKDLTRVYNLGLFDQVGPLDEQPTDVGKVVIAIPVVEKRSGQVSVGVGYSSTSKLVGRAELAQNNFRGMGERVSVNAEVGGISSTSSLRFSFFEPYLDSKHTSLNVSVYNEVIYRFSNNVYSSGTQTGSSSDYTEQHRGVTFGVNRPLSDTRSAGLTFRTESVKSNNFNTPIQDTFIRQQGTVTALGAQYSNNTRDQDFSPASGGLFSGSYEYGLANTTTVGNSPSPLAPGRHNVSKVGVDLRQYISLQGPRKPGDLKSAKRVFAVHLLLGFSNRDVPFFEQYFLGGADSLRGADTDRFWGNSLALGQAELRIPVSKSDSFQGVLFTDIGDAWGSIYQGQGLAQHNQFSLQSDYGVGVRLVTPIGPIRVDYALGRGGGKTQFSIGQSF